MIHVCICSDSQALNSQEHLYLGLCDKVLEVGGAAGVRREQGLPCVWHSGFWSAPKRAH